jgi:isochorismate hydrolase
LSQITTLQIRCVLSFPVREEHFVKKARERSTMWEQLEIAAQYQHYWADNSVSITVTFKPEEAEQTSRPLLKCTKLA